MNEAGTETFTSVRVDAAADFRGTETFQNFFKCFSSVLRSNSGLSDAPSSDHYCPKWKHMFQVAERLERMTEGWREGWAEGRGRKNKPDVSGTGLRPSLGYRRSETSSQGPR